MSLSKHLKNTSLPLELPLHSAARLPADAAGPMVRLLLAARASPHERDQFGRTATQLMAPQLAEEVRRGQGGGEEDGERGAPAPAPSPAEGEEFSAAVYCV